MNVACLTHNRPGSALLDFLGSALLDCLGSALFAAWPSITRGQPVSAS